MRVKGSYYQILTENFWVASEPQFKHLTFESRWIVSKVSDPGNGCGTYEDIESPVPTLLNRNITSGTKENV